MSLSEDFLSTEDLHPIDIVEVARHLGMTRRALELHFHRAHCRPPAKEFARMRIEKAKKMLASSGMSAKEIAGACGFQDVKRLFRTFKREVGTTPIGYRQKLHGGH